MSSYEELRDDLDLKEGVLSSYNGIENAPRPLLASIRSIQKRLAYIKYERNIISKEKLISELREADERFKAVLRPEGDYIRLSESDNRDEVLQTVMRNPAEFKSLTARYRGDREIAMAAVSKNGYNLYRVSEALKDDKELVLAAVKYDGECLAFASSRLKDDKEVVLAALHSDNRNRRPFDLGVVSKRLRDDKEIVMEAVQKTGKNLYYASDRLKDDKDVVMVALKNGASLTDVSERLQKDREVFIETLMHGKNWYWSLNYHNDDREIVLMAVKKDGLSLDRASDRLKDDIEVVKAAIAQNERASQFAGAKAKEVLDNERKSRSIFASEEKTMSAIKLAFQLRLISSEIDYLPPTSFVEIPENILHKMRYLDELYLNNIISYDMVIELITDLFEREGVKMATMRYGSEITSKLINYYKGLEIAYHDILSLLEARKITVDRFISDYVRLRVSESFTIEKVVSLGQPNPDHSKQ